MFNTSNIIFSFLKYLKLFKRNAFKCITTSFVIQKIFEIVFSKFVWYQSTLIWNLFKISNFQISYKKSISFLKIDEIMNAKKRLFEICIFSRIFFLYLNENVNSFFFDVVSGFRFQFVINFNCFILNWISSLFLLICFNSIFCWMFLISIRSRTQKTICAFCCIMFQSRIIRRISFF